MYEFNFAALDRVVSSLAGVKPYQIDMAYWRKTRPGLPHSQTVCCAGGWVCLMGGFSDDGLKLIAIDPREPDFGHVPALKGQHGKILYGYAAMGWVLQAHHDNDRADAYGRAIFALPGRSELDKRFQWNPLDPRWTVLQRVQQAKIMAEEVVLLD